ncbi:hypothetical protein L596_014829 [Steinernema carpocapsae]|uniref:DH domain-containing protein n=1 Tax=Steinernema carpocapsae TaxID=34508 RepID=A0A4V6A2X2_STECR|nr:hypothetical protein L596_014829 [Steinernema carpocapsae]
MYYCIVKSSISTVSVRSSHSNRPNLYDAVVPALESRRSVRSFRQKRSRSQPLHTSSIHVEEYSDGTESTNRVPSMLISSDDSIEQFSLSSSSKETTDSGVTFSGHDSRLIMAKAICANVALLADDLPFSTGDFINVLDSTSHAALWFGMCADRTGWFLASHVTIIDPSAPSEWQNNPGFSHEMRQLRKRVLHELLITEKDYVTLLHNVVVGFVEQCRRHKELFSAALVESIFGNIEKLAVLHAKLLSELESAVDRKNPENSALADVFLRNSTNFEIYSDYCNNRMISCAILGKMLEDTRYVHFFEACRLLRGMPRLNLESFLLSPVQRMCRYPIQLRELLKATPVLHPDRKDLEKALVAMKGIASRVDRRVNRLESIQKLIKWQQNVIGFRGPNLIENNCRLLHFGEVSGKCFAKSALQWSKTVHLVLFDQSMVVCKKIVKKNECVFKERFSLSAARFADVTDGKDGPHAFQITTQNRSYIFNCKDADAKSEWLEKLRTRPSPNPPTVNEMRFALLSLKHR